jgi:hypothetical protein
MFGTHAGTVHGISPTGKQFQQRQFHLFRMRAGQIVEHLALRDVQQVIVPDGKGAIPNAAYGCSPAGVREAGVVRGKEEGGLGDFIGLADAACPAPSSKPLKGPTTALHALKNSPTIRSIFIRSNGLLPIGHNPPCILLRFLGKRNIFFSGSTILSIQVTKSLYHFVPL